MAVVLVVVEGGQGMDGEGKVGVVELEGVMLVVGLGVAMVRVVLGVMVELEEVWAEGVGGLEAAMVVVLGAVGVVLGEMTGQVGDQEEVVVLVAV